MAEKAYAVYGGMTMERFNQHWLVLKQCEAGGAKPAVYRELLETIGNMRAKLIEAQLADSARSADTKATES